MGKEKQRTKTVGVRASDLHDCPLSALRKLRKYNDSNVFINDNTGRPFWGSSVLNGAWYQALAALELGHSIKMFFEVYAKWVNVSKRKEDLAKVNQSVAKVWQKCGND